MSRISNLAVLLMVGLVCATAPVGSVQQPPAAATTSKVWVGRNAEFEEFLRTAEIDRDEGVAVGTLGVRRAFFKPGGLAASATIRSIKPGNYRGYWESYLGDVAAYELDRLLELDMVPPTVVRRHDGVPVSLQLWAENVRMLKQIQEANQHPSDVDDYNFQLRRQKVFHNLTGNLDPNQGNILFDPSWNIILVDFSRAFSTTNKLIFDATAIDRAFFDRVKALDRDTLRRELGELVAGDGAVDAVLRRRDEIVKVFERLAKSKGEAQVFVP